MRACLVGVSCLRLLRFVIVCVPDASIVCVCWSACLLACLRVRMCLLVRVCRCLFRGVLAGLVVPFVCVFVGCAHRECACVIVSWRPVRGKGYAILRLWARAQDFFVPGQEYSTFRVQETENRISASAGQKLPPIQTF